MMNWKDKIQELEANWTPPAAEYLPPADPPPALIPIPYNPMSAPEVLIYDATVAAEQIEAWRPRAKAGDVNASKELRNWQQRRATLLGLDAPKELYIDIHRRDPNNLKSYTTAELEQMLAEQMAIPGESTRTENE